jgi:hypothetical protein
MILAMASDSNLYACHIPKWDWHPEVPVFEKVKGPNSIPPFKEHSQIVPEAVKVHIASVRRVFEILVKS